MAQIIKHRRGSLESLSAVTSSLQKGEIVIASGSSNLSVTNGASLVFAVPENGTVQAANRFLIGNAAPNSFASSTYNGMLNGVPYFDSGSGTLYLLGGDGNTAISLIGNIQPFSQSVDSRLDAVEASLGGGGAISTRVDQLSAATASVNDFTASTLGHISDINSYTASVSGHISDINSYTASVNGHISDINSYTASNDTNITELFTSSSAAKVKNDAQDGRLNNLEATSASVNGHIVDVNTWSASVKGHVVDINSYTASLKAAFTASGTDVIFSGDVTIPGNFTVQGTQTIVDSQTVQIGDNIIELNGSGAANGGIYVKDPTAPNTATGSLIWDSTNDYWKAGVKDSEIKVLLAGSDGVISGSSQITISDTTGYSSFSSSIASNVVELFATSSDHESRLDTIEASVGGGGSVSTRIDQLAAATASVNSFTQSTLGHIADINAYTASNDTTNTLQSTRIDQLAAATASVNSFTASANSFTASATNRLNNLESTSASVNGHISDINAWSGSAKTSITTLEAKAVTLQTYTASVDGHIADINTWSASVKGHIVDINSYTASNDSAQTAQNNRLSNIETFTSSFGTTFSSSVDSRLDVLEGTGTIQGVGTGNDVTFVSVTTTGNMTVGGDLVVQGNTVTLNTSQLVIEDKLITLASGSTSNATADGAGFEVAGTAASFKYDGTNNQFSSSVNVVANVTGSVNVPGYGTSKRAAFRNAAGNLDFVTAPTTTGDLLQWDGSDFVMSNVIDGGSF